MTDEDGNIIRKPTLTFRQHQKQKFDNIKSILKPYVLSKEPAEPEVSEEVINLLYLLNNK